MRHTRRTWRRSCRRSKREKGRCAVHRRLLCLPETPPITVQIPVQADVKYTDLKPQMVNIHTIAPRMPALKVLKSCGEGSIAHARVCGQVGMNALGHRMFHVHSDEQEAWSAEIMSSGLSAGFTMTDRVKGLQKGDGKEGSQWTLYSQDKSFRVKVPVTVTTGLGRC